MLFYRHILREIRRNLVAPFTSTPFCPAVYKLRKGTSLVQEFLPGKERFVGPVDFPVTHANTAAALLPSSSTTKATNLSFREELSSATSLFMSLPFFVLFLLYEQERCESSSERRAFLNATKRLYVERLRQYNGLTTTAQHELLKRA